jgi:hypothetical protein
MASEANDPVLDALEDLEEALHDNIRRNEQALLRAREIRRQRQVGNSYREIVSPEARPLIVELIAENMKALATAGAHLRREMAQALRNEGLTIDGIAQLFGVSRQRISELLRRPGLGSVVLFLTENQPF